MELSSMQVITIFCQALVLLLLLLLLLMIKYKCDENDADRDADTYDVAVGIADVVADVIHEQN